jgi:hypothetical protein
VIFVVALFVRAPRAALWMTAAVAAFGAFEAAYVFHRYSNPVLTRESTPVGFDSDWIDQAVAGRHRVALVPSPHDAPTSWWDAEYWNKKTTRLLRVDGGRTFSPFPSENVSVDYAHGVLRGPQPSEFLLVSPRETRFRSGRGPWSMRRPFSSCKRRGDTGSRGRLEASRRTGGSQRARR